MCFDGELPDFCKRTTPVARKPHKCCECRRAIQPKEKYERVSGKWDFGIETYCTCMACVALREKVRSIEEREGCSPYESTPPFCELIDAAYEYGLFPAA